MRDASYVRGITKTCPVILVSYHTLFDYDFLIMVSQGYGDWNRNSHRRRKVRDIGLIFFIYTILYVLSVRIFFHNT